MSHTIVIASETREIHARSTTAPALGTNSLVRQDKNNGNRGTCVSRMPRALSSRRRHVTAIPPLSLASFSDRSWSSSAAKAPPPPPPPPPPPSVPLLAAAATSADGIGRDDDRHFECRGRVRGAFRFGCDTPCHCHCHSTRLGRLLPDKAPRRRKLVNPAERALEMT